MNSVAYKGTKAVTCCQELSGKDFLDGFLLASVLDRGWAPSADKQDLLILAAIFR
jgi:hypothetical protein